MEGIDGGLFVPVIGGCDQDGIDVGASEDFAVVAGGEEIGAPEFFCVGEAAVVAVGDGDELDAGDLESDAGVVLALDAGADESEMPRRGGGGRGFGWARSGGRILSEERVQTSRRGSNGGGLQG